MYHSAFKHKHSFPFLCCLTLFCVEKYHMKSEGCFFNVVCCHAGAWIRCVRHLFRFPVTMLYIPHHLACIKTQKKLNKVKTAFQELGKTHRFLPFPNIVYLPFITNHEQFGGQDVQISSLSKDCMYTFLPSFCDKSAMAYSYWPVSLKAVLLLPCFKCFLCSQLNFQGSRLLLSVRLRKERR